MLRFISSWLAVMLVLALHNDPLVVLAFDFAKQPTGTKPVGASPSLTACRYAPEALIAQRTADETALTINKSATQNNLAFESLQQRLSHHNDQIEHSLNKHVAFSQVEVLSVPAFAKKKPKRTQQQKLSTTNTLVQRRKKLSRLRQQRKHEQRDENQRYRTHAASAAGEVEEEDPPRKDPSALLTKDEEVLYASQLRSMRAAIRTRDELVKEQKGLFIHPTEEKWAQACGFQTVHQLRELMLVGQEARNILCSANVGLVTSIAKRHYKNLKYASEAGNGSVGTILTLNDIVQEGNLGLMEAAERFDPERGYRFSTYATWWIRQRILRAISESSRVIRLPAHVHGILYKIKRARLEIQAASGQPATLAQLSNKLGLSEKKLKLYTESSRNVVSLEVPLVGHSSKMDANPQTLGDTLASDAPTPDEDAEANYLKRDILHVIETELAEQERDVILHRFGFVEAPPTLNEDRCEEGNCDDLINKRRRNMTTHGTCFTVAQTARALGISVDRVRLIEARALNKLRSPQRNYRLREYVRGDATSPRPSLANRGRLGDSNDLAQEHDLFAASPYFGTNNSRVRIPKVGAYSSSNSVLGNNKPHQRNSAHKRSFRMKTISKNKRHSDIAERGYRDYENSSSNGTAQNARADRMWFF